MSKKLRLPSSFKYVPSESDRELMADLEREIETDDFSRWEPVDIRVAKDLTISFIVRMSTEDYKDFSKAAEARGMRLDDLMYLATHAAIKGEIDVETAAKALKSK